MRANFAWSYYGEILNGGHSQLVHNFWNDGRAAYEYAIDGLEAMGASAQAAVARDLLGWIDAHPEEADAQTGFEGGRAPELDKFDDRFMAADQETPLTHLAAAWCAGLPGLLALPDAEAQATITALVEASGQRLS